MATSGQPLRAEGAVEGSVTEQRGHPSSTGRALPSNSEFRLYPGGPLARIEVANTGDHPLVRSFLAMFGGESGDDFAHWHDAPRYAPSDRLLIRLDGRLIGHVHLVRRSLVWGDVCIPSVGLNDLAVLPEFSDSGCRRRVLMAAAAQATDDGSLVATMRDRGGDPLIAELGWIPCPSHAVTQASARDVLAYLSPQPRASRPRRAPRVRLWRRVQLPDLMSVYRAAVADRCGAVERSEPYWQWLLSRKVQEQVLVAERPTGHDTRPTVVGYAMTRGDRVIELMTLPGHDPAAVALLLRACRDVIENGFQSIALHLPTDHSLHELLLTSGGAYASGRNTPSGELLMQVLDAGQLVKAMTPLYHARARSARIGLPIEQTLDIEGKAVQFVLSRRGARLIDATGSRPDVVCRESDFHRLLIGRLPACQAINDGRLGVASDDARRMLSLLFPHHLVWQSPLDSRGRF